MLRRKWWEKLGGFDYHFPLAEDLDFALRLALKGCKAVWLKETLTCYRQHNSNIMSSGLSLMKNTEIVMKEFFERPDLPQSIRQLKNPGTLSMLQVAGMADVPRRSSSRDGPVFGKIIALYAFFAHKNSLELAGKFSDGF